MTGGHTKAYDYLSELEPAIKTELEKAVVYQRFVFERAKLSKIVDRLLSETGKLNSPEALAQEKVVAALGMDVLAEISTIQFMLNEPPCEELMSHVGK